MAHAAAMAVLTSTSGDARRSTVNIAASRKHEMKTTAVVAGNPARSDIASAQANPDRKSTRLNSSHLGISYAVFCLKKIYQKLNKSAEEAIEQFANILEKVRRRGSDEHDPYVEAKYVTGPTLFFFNDTASTEIYTLSLHAALPI